jgi:antirestriction protein ArdC
MATTMMEPDWHEPVNVEKRDFRREVTDRIISMLEDGVAPWQKPWDAEHASPEMPMNPISGRSYRGGNALNLMASALQKGYEDPRWMTYRQAAGQGWYVRRGEKGTQIEFWDVRAGQEAEAPQSAEQEVEGSLTRNHGGGSQSRRFLRRVYTVFNATQVEGVPAWAPKERNTFEVVRSAEQILAASGVAIIHDQADSAFYNRSSDRIHLPPKEAFRDAGSFYGTALHELAHASGHPTRLNRATLNESYRFGDLNYAKEELRAELGSLFLAAERGIPHDPAQHAAYIDSWITALRQDKHEIFRAAHDASSAADFLLALERERSIVHEGVSQSNEQVTRMDRDPADSLRAAHAITTRELGDTAKTVRAKLESGAYRGVIIGETEEYVVQRQRVGNAVAHPKQLLAREVGAGENVSITYANGKANVRAVRERARTRELGR